MIAKFIKAEPTKEGITFTLKAEFDKAALHEAVDLQGEECNIELSVKENTIKTDRIMQIFDSLIAALKEEHDNNKQV
jgi:uncharacterized OsmC-like protein